MVNFNIYLIYCKTKDRNEVKQYMKICANKSFYKTINFYKKNLEQSHSF